MPIDNPAASSETLPPFPAPDKIALAKARVGLDRVRLWMRGDATVTLADGDLEALELIAHWLQTGAVLDRAAKAEIANALQIAVGHIEAPCGGGLQREAVERIKRAGSILNGGERA